MRKLNQLWVPGGAFLLAVALSIVAAPSNPAVARQAADATGSDCQSHIRDIRGWAKARNLRIDPLLPEQSSGKIRTRSRLDFYGGVVRSGAPAKSENFVMLGSQVQLTVGNSFGSKVITLTLPALGDPLERFELNGLRWKRNLESEFHEHGRDLARLLQAALSDLASQGEFYSFDPGTKLYTFRQLSSSDTYFGPVDGVNKPCASDTHVLPLVLQTIEGYGNTFGFQFE